MVNFCKQVAKANCRKTHIHNLGTTNTALPTRKKSKYSKDMTVPNVIDTLPVKRVIKFEFPIPVTQSLISMEKRGRPGRKLQCSFHDP